MTVRLSDYDCVVLNTSAGKDSQTAMRAVMQQARSEGYPTDRIVAAHADLGEMEWPGTHELATVQAAHYGLTLWTVRKATALLDYVEQRGRWMDSQNRFCTAGWKRDEIAKLFTELVSSWGLAEGKQARILNVMGFRAEESPARAKLPVLALNKRSSSGVRRIDNWLPIHSMTTEDVWRDIRASGVPYHFAYDLGMPRLSCVFCFFSPKEALMLAGRANPELLDKCVGIEQRTGHRFTDKLSLEHVRAAIARGEDWGQPKNWVM